MIINVELDINTCDDCPFKHHSYGYGESFDYCKHPNAPFGYEAVIYTTDKPYPEWCPIFKKDDNE